MKILTIGSERNLFKDNSEAQKRIKEYGQLYDELRIIVFSNAADENSNLQLGGNIFIYPTNHKVKLFYLWDIYKIVNSWNSWKPDMITCQDPFESGLAGWLLKFFLKTSLQLQVHTDIFSPYFGQESLKNKIQLMLAKFLLPKADGIRVVSERIKQSLKSNVKGQMSNVIVLPIFVDIKKIQSAKIKADLHKKYPDYDFIILMASRLSKEKNIGMAIEAMKELSLKSKVKSKMLLLIVGDGPEKEKLIVKCRMLNVVDNVKFEPWTDDLVSYYKTSDLFLLISNYEGYGRTAIEAMAAGLPVVMTDVGLAGEILVDDLDGRIVPVGDAKALIEAILQLLENPLKREEFKQNSLKSLKKWPTKKEYLERYKNSLSFNKMLK
ncbi:MAG: glycosyltransferase family 4 protein [bacterium]|nr:glycosyltransferase family 4 protein [bacterium]